MKTSPLLCALALAACGNNQPSSTPSAGHEPAPAKIAAQVPSAPSFRARLAAAQFVHETDVDASALGDHVEAYLITRYGAAGDDPVRDQQIDLSLALFGDDAAIRVDLGKYDVMVTPKRPFGTIAASTGELKPFDGAAAWTGGPPLLAQTVVDMIGDTVSFAVTREDDELVVWYTDVNEEVGPNDHWDRDTFVRLAAGAKVTTPAPQLDAAPLAGTIPVRLTDAPLREDLGAAWYIATLEIGELAGPLGEPSATVPDATRWTIPAVTNSLPGPLPHADAYLAHREYLGSLDDRLLVGRDGDALVVWERLDASGLEGMWEETLRVPLPKGAKLDVR